jgi:tRNA 2-thiocytidine biosynthesis protein TtcA
MASRFLRTAHPREVVTKLVEKAVLEHHMVEKGDRILIACSGGKDSTTLAWALAQIRPAVEAAIGGSYTLHALHISSDFCSCCKKAFLRLFLHNSGIDFEDRFVPVIGRLKPGRKMNCYWCSTQRRTELLRASSEGGYNKIALGHHLDDIIETYFMNLLQKGEPRGMPLVMQYDKYPVSIIRPLALLEEKQIIACAGDLGVLAAACTCPYGVNSGRKDMRKRIAAFTGGDGAVKRRILKGIVSACVGGQCSPGL